MGAWGHGPKQETEGTRGRRRQGSRQGCCFPFGPGEIQFEIHSAQSRAMLFPSVTLCSSRAYLTLQTRRPVRGVCAWAVER